MVLSTTMTDTMPQTVPSLGFATSTASFDLSAAFTADSFDLSLLPSSGCDSEVPYSPQNDHQLLLSLYYDTTSPPPMFPAQLPADQELYKQPVIKEEPFTTSSLHRHHQQQNCWDTSSCCSSNPSPEYCASPQYPISPKIKQEATIDLEEILKESKYLQDNYYHTAAPAPPPPPQQQRNKKDLIIRTILERDDYEQQQEQKPVTDHQLLREVLKDTSFQRKYNLKPFDIGGLGTAFKTEIKMETVESTDPGEGQSGEPSSSASAAASCPVDLTQENIEPVFSLAIEQLKEDVNNTCTVLGISRDPTQWSVEDVRSWLVWNLQQYNLPMSVVEYFSISGATLVQLTEEEFQQRTPQCGSLLYAQLEIWKAACLQGTNIDVSGLLHDSTTQSSSSCGDASDDDEDDDIADSPQTSHSSPHSKTSGGRGGSHIHLWQFLKELLATPQVNGACIRWIDRSKGIFKIEDSVRVARLWGKRKNRPAMNYDKLSRSIRQYYKKGIMKKTERSQRLVYQFCHPYCL